MKERGMTMNQQIFEETDLIALGNETMKALVEAEIQDIIKAHEGKAPELLAQALDDFFQDMKAMLSDE